MLGFLGKNKACVEKNSILRATFKSCHTYSSSSWVAHLSVEAVFQDWKSQYMETE